jgi:hypothetical protein
MRYHDETESVGVIINEVQFILAEKRTALSTLRTGIAVFALPLTVFSVLVATSKYYSFIHVIHFMIPLLILCASLVFLGFYLVLRSLSRIHHYDRLILDIKRKHSQIAEFLD